MTAFGDRDMIKARSRGGTSTILVVEEDSKILGTTALSRWGSVGYIGRMAVDSTHRLSLGDTVILQRGSTCRGFAICHVGAGTEAGNGFCY
jgi:N-acetylglutamate synthase-like GNAT family acetyltransferase